MTFVEWMLVDFDYKLDGAYDNGDGTGTVYADVTLRDSMAFATTFMEDAQAAIDAATCSPSTRPARRCFSASSTRLQWTRPPP